MLGDCTQSNTRTAHFAKSSLNGKQLLVSLKRLDRISRCTDCAALETETVWTFPRHLILIMSLYLKIPSLYLNRAQISFLSHLYCSLHMYPHACRYNRMSYYIERLWLQAGKSRQRRSMSQGFSTEEHCLSLHNTMFVDVLITMEFSHVQITLHRFCGTNWCEVSLWDAGYMLTLINKSYLVSPISYHPPPSSNHPIACG